MPKSGFGAYSLPVSKYVKRWPGWISPDKINKFAKSQKSCSENFKK
jgi:hypothetical protein